MRGGERDIYTHQLPWLLVCEYFKLRHDDEDRLKMCVAFEIDDCASPQAGRQV